MSYVEEYAWYETMVYPVCAAVQVSSLLQEEEAAAAAAVQVGSEDYGHADGALSVENGDGALCIIDAIDANLAGGR